MKHLLFIIIGSLNFIFLHAQNAFMIDWQGVKELKQQFAKSKQGQSPGFSILMAYKDSVVLQHQEGLADVASKTPITPNTMFYIGSVAKTFTAAAILKLRQEKQLNLSDKLHTWLPGLPAFTSDVRLYHLLTHISGIPDYYSAMGEDLHDFHNADVIKFVKQLDSLLFEPGMDYAYSNTAYILLAEVVEKASGKKFTTYVKEQLLLPAGMHQTIAIDEPGIVLPNRAKGYKNDSLGKYELNDYQDIYTVGAGGYYSTPGDLHKWMMALKSGKIISHRSFGLMTSFPITLKGNKSYLGMGWNNESYAKTAGLENLVVYRSIGGLKGFRSMIIYLPYNDVHLIVSTNNGEMGIELVEILKMVLRKK
jgi:CubicO group peptidase (beta-lactamase class C family)